MMKGRDSDEFDRHDPPGESRPTDARGRSAKRPINGAIKPSTYGAFGVNAAGIVTVDTYESAPRVRRSADWARVRLSTIDAAIALAIVAAALLVRWPFIDKGETLLHSDEAVVGLMAQDIAEGRRFPIYFYGQRYMGALEAYVIAAISPLFNDPIHALRFGPACFFAALVAVQYLMLARWFGRRGGLFGAAVLLAAAPMFVQWSVSARGGYVEILLWGTLLLWTYAEWFVPDSHPSSAGNRRPGRGPETGSRKPKGVSLKPAIATRLKPEIADLRYGRHRFLFGALLGSGFWINPSIMLFVVPILAHALLHRPLAALYSSRPAGALVDRVVQVLGRTALPLTVLAAVVLMNAVHAVWVDHGRVRSLLFLGLLPKPAALALLGAAATMAGAVLLRRPGLLARGRALLQADGVMVLGILVGALPAVLYVGQAIVGLRALDPSLPLGIRPIWLTGDPLIQLLHGLPILFGADPRLFLQLVSVGRDTAIEPLDIVTSGVAIAANLIALGALLSTALLVLISYQAHWDRLLRLIPARHPPVVLLGLGFAGTILLYVFGGCTLDFTTIRYLVPLWAFLPGLMAACIVAGVDHRPPVSHGGPCALGRAKRLLSRLGRWARLAPVCAVLAWSVGQSTMSSRLGGPHPLRGVAAAVIARGCDFAVAEPLDAHLLSYLTRQQCRVTEFESFWPRLGHYQGASASTGPANYIVQTRELDRTQDWIDGGWPGEPPPETKRFLWPRLRSALNADPTLLLAREPLSEGYELFRLREALPERLLVGGEAR